MAEKINLPLNRRELDMLDDDEKDHLIDEFRINRQMLERMPATPRYRAPYLPSFSGDSKSGEYRNWKRAVLSAMDNFDEYTVIQAIRKSISSQPARIISNLDYDCSVDDIINALNNAYDDIHEAPNDTAYKRWSCHSGFKLLCKLCRTSPPPAMGA